jgi:molybdopterin-containing oxidoreductase family iron-sulfur binding subunit
VDSARPTTPLDLTAIRRRLADERGQTLWRSLEELAGSDEFIEFLEYEFPRQAAGIREAGTGRRDFLKLMSASLALAGLGACTKQPEEPIVPYVKQPEQVVLGLPLYFATAMPLGGFGVGLIAESHEGRPTKVEGNAGHPASLGASDVAAQGSVLGLYDPDRSKVVTSAGQIRTWQALIEMLGPVREAQRAKGGAGLRILTGTVTSPTLAAQIQSVLDVLPQARWHQWDPIGRDAVRLGARRSFGQDVETQYRFDQAQVIVALDADFMTYGPGRLRYARDLMRGRRLGAGRSTMNRFYAAESTPSVTGSVADHRLAVRAQDVESIGRAIAAALGVNAAAPADPAVVTAHRAWIDAAVADLQAQRGASVVIAGDQQPPVVHALAHAINQSLGNVGKTVLYTEPVEARPEDQLASLRTLIADMQARAVECLLILGVNPVYDAPADLDFAGALQQVALRVHHGLYADETARICHWHSPAAHYLESWDDVRAYDGTVSLIQPLIAPLYGGRTAAELLAAFAGQGGMSAHDLVRAQWQQRHAGTAFDAFWEQSLRDGVVAGTAAPAKAVALRGGWDPGATPLPPAEDGIELTFRPDPYVLDGQFTNNGWLLELPRPLTKVTWDNVALVAPATAERLGVTSEDLVELRFRGRSVRAPVWVTPGQAAGSVTVGLGFGRTHVGHVGDGVGFHAGAIRPSEAFQGGAGLQVVRTGARYRIASTQDHQTMAGRPLVRRATLAEWQAHPEFARHLEEMPGPELSLYPPKDYPGHAWGMSIDLGSCIGCNACVAACVAENNVSVVGKEQVAHGREMQWIRIDRYYTGDLETPEILHQPVPCMHCEKAPCEVVCPVNATVHSSEGLNDMVYNRCVGTRYCSNNCPYKVRRFNYFLYANWTSETIAMARNPQVTVRSRGVMEKCTYCVQRIERARAKAKLEDRPIRDGEIVTACQQACPTEAIVFGDQNDPESRVAKLKADPRNYTLLAELNTRPRTTYLAGVTNPNPQLASASGAGHEAAPGPARETHS